MPSNKKRLYIALYPSGPKSETKETVPGYKFHVKNSPLGWTFEEVQVEDVRNTNPLLIRVMIAKIQDEERLTALLRRVPVVQNDPNWRCRSWIADALSEIAKDGSCVGTAELNWEKIEAFARKYVREKTANGRFKSAEDLVGSKPTWDLLEDKETVP
ncbi:hypothetical protein M011DRAFT_212600 [Sporormia fimetaria CBS 119925]|uniref:Uncharacterized protein n=1 Tax=Sporormia fimetaria CBS 119925 TaxID=1340428 RepID=A0A6A6V1T7_9PLEO|nr:hypothetical protein M011DRAFT_212600 [Sporormia fimetaria CBS 119925]